MTDNGNTGGNAGDDDRQIMFGHHVVTLIDLLGQQSKLAEWDFLPETAYDKQKFIAAVRQSFGKVTVWREQFEKYYKLWLDSSELPKGFAKTLPDGGRAYREFAETSLRFMRFSDTIVIYSPVVNQYDHANAGTVLAHMYTCGLLMLAALNGNTVFRGAIELGMAGQIDKAELYGPVVAAVHRLESAVAEYPRILVGQRLHEYLIAQVENPEDSAPSRNNRGVASNCLRLAGCDLDGERILDYMGTGFADMATQKEDWQMLRDGACAFAKRERDRFLRSGDQKLTDRYNRLCAYHDSRGVS